MTELPDPARFAHITDWVFDLDNTLYPHHSNLFSQIDVRMTAYVSELLTLPREEARALQKQLYREYGTTLAGLIARHGIDATLVTSKGQASKIIGKVMQRLDGGLCSIRQLNFLHKLGIDASSLTREEASQAIATRLASRKSGHAQRPDTAAL